MRLLRSLLLAGLLALALAGGSQAASLSARTAGSKSFELRNGVGRAVVSDRGTVLGRVRRGLIRVDNLPNGPAPVGFVRGCERRTGTLRGRLVCRGTDLSFYISSGDRGRRTWRLRVQGRGIDISGVARGWIALGLLRAEPRRGGTYSIDGGAFRSWPLSWRSIRLAP